MSLHQNHFNSLSELERLAALTQHLHLLPEIDKEQWPLAILATCLVHSNHEEMLEHCLVVYRAFQEQVDLAGRARSLQTLALFLAKNQGRGYRAFLPYALADNDEALRRQAAYLLASYAPEEGEERFPGLRCLQDMLRSRSDAPTSLLEGMLELADLRAKPYLLELIEGLDSRHLESLTAIPSRLYFDWLCEILQREPEQSERICACMARSIVLSEEVIDLILPIPTWQFRNAEPQPLHSWTRPEYFARLQSAITPYLSEAQLSALCQRFSS